MTTMALDQAAQLRTLVEQASPAPAEAAPFTPRGRPRATVIEIGRAHV